MFTSPLKNAIHKIALGFLTFLACLGLISLFLNKVDAACDPAAGPCVPETSECTDTTGAPMPCPPEEPSSECGDSRTNPCPEDECDPATEDCGSGFSFEPGGGSGECFDQAGATVPCEEEECDPATEDCGSGFSFEPGGGSGECFDQAGATVPCEEEECDPATEDCGSGFSFEPGDEDPNTPNFNPNDPGEPVCETRANPNPCPEEDPGCINAAGAPVNCDPNQFDFCDPVTENCGNTTDFCDHTTENCGNTFDFCDSKKEICSNFVPECDPAKEICKTVQPTCMGENCTTTQTTPKPETTPKTFTINKSPTLRPAAPNNPNSASTTTSPPRLASTGPAAILLIFAPVLGYAISRKK